MTYSPQTQSLINSVAESINPRNGMVEPMVFGSNGMGRALNQQEAQQLQDSGYFDAVRGGTGDQWLKQYRTGSADYQIGNPAAGQPTVAGAPDPSSGYQAPYVSSTAATFGGSPQQQERPTMFPGGSPTFNENGGGGALADQQQRLQMHGAPIPTDGGTGGGMAWPNANPWLQAQGQAVAQQTTDALTRGMLPAIQRGAALSSGYGGSRQSIGEGLAVGEATKGLAGQLANLYGTQFNNDRNYGLQSDALDWNIYQGNNQIQRQGQLDQLGALGQFLNWGQAYGIGNANQVQQTPIDYWKTFTNGASQIAGQGGSTSTPYYGNPLMGAIGGWQMGNSIFGG